MTKIRVQGFLDITPGTVDRTDHIGSRARVGRSVPATLKQPDGRVLKCIDIVLVHQRHTRHGQSSRNILRIGFRKIPGVISPRRQAIDNYPERIQLVVGHHVVGDLCYIGIVVGPPATRTLHDEHKAVKIAVVYLSIKYRAAIGHRILIVRHRTGLPDPMEEYNHGILLPIICRGVVRPGELQPERHSHPVGSIIHIGLPHVRIPVQPYRPDPLANGIKGREIGVIGRTHSRIGVVGVHRIGRVQNALRLRLLYQQTAKNK